MILFRSAVIMLLLSAAAVHAALPRLAVVSIDIDDFSPDSAIIAEVADELQSSGRFQMVDLGDESYITVSPDSIMEAFRTLAADNRVDVFLALEVLYPEQTDRTVYRNDSLITFREVSVNVLGRFYTSSGNLIGSLQNSVSREEVLPYAPDPHRLAVLSARELASRSILELFPMEVTFSASDAETFTVPLGTAQGISKGTVMAVVAICSGIPDDVSTYENLRSRGLMQIMDAGQSESTARLLSGSLVSGAEVTAVEQSAPASLFLEYNGTMMDVQAGEGLPEENTVWGNNVRLGVQTAKWGFAFGGGINAGGLEHSSLIGVDLQAGTRIPVSSPALGLRLSAGGEMAFHMQDVRSDIISSNATAFSIAATADATMEYLFSGHLGVQVGVTGLLGTAAKSWTVQEYTGNVRDAEPSELYYTELKQGPVNVHAGLMYFMF